MPRRLLGRPVASSCFFLAVKLFLIFSLFVSAAIAGESQLLIDAKESLLSFRERQGRAPSDVDLFLLVLKHERAFSYKDLSTLYQIIRKENKSEFTKEALLSIVQAKRSSIRDFQCSYRSDEVYINQVESNFSTECRYKMKDNLFFKADRITKHAGLPRSDMTFYDGEKFTHYYTSGDGSPNGTVEIHDDMPKETFQDDRLPISTSMLRDPAKLGIEGSNFAYDLVHLAEATSSMVCEDRESIDGRECVVLCNWYTRVWLAIEYDFSPVKVEDFFFLDHQIDGVDVIDKRLLVESRECRDYQDFGNGIWLPGKVVTQYFDPESGVPSGSRNTVASLMKVNSELTEGEFTAAFAELVPDGTIAVDGSKQLIYEWGDHPSVGGLVNDVVTRKQNIGFLWLVNFGIVVLLVCVVCYRRYRRKKHGIN